MKKTKILTILGVMLAMGLTACGGKPAESKPADESKPAESQPESKPAESSKQDESKPQQSSQPQPSSSEAPAGLFENVPDPDGHHFGAEEDVAADAELGTVAMKKALCADGDNVLKYAVNQSVVTFATGSSNKAGTPEGYVKLNKDGNSLSFKVKMSKIFSGKLYLLGRMDGYSTESNQTVGLYRQGSPNIQVEINGKKADLSSKSTYKYSDTFGTEAVATGLDSPSNYLSHEGYVEVCDVVLDAGANEFIYTRKASQNMIVRDFVLIGKEFDSEWAEGQQVAAADGSIAYVKYANNLYPEMVKVEWKAMDGTLAEGSAIKANTPAGYLKLDGNTQKMNYQFNFDADLDGQLYQRGAMDGYPGNASCTYFSQTKGAKYGNFEMKVNGSVVYYGDKRDVTYGQMLGTAAATGDASIGSGYSEVKDCLIGDAFLKNGVNTASFERVDSYNLAISHFVFIGKKVAAAHVNPAVDAAYEGQDEASHWQKVDGDSFKFNRGEHHWIADADETDTTSTCTVKGQKHYKCEICGMKKVEELELAAHTWVSDLDLADQDTTSTCSTHGIAHVKCEVCGAKETQELPFAEHTWGEAQTKIGGAVPYICSECNAVRYDMDFADTSNGHAAGKFNSGEAIWNIAGIQAGTYDIYVDAGISSSNINNAGFAKGEIRYKWRVDEGEYVNPTTGDETYGESGVKASSSSHQWTKAVSRITIGESAAQFEMKYFGSGYSLNVYAVRIVKVAA